MKRKVLSLLLVLSLAFSLIGSFPLISQAAIYGDFSQEITKHEIWLNDLSATISVTNHTSSREIVKLYLAVYSSENRLKGVVSQETLVQANKTISTTLSIENYTQETGDYIKTFIWDENDLPLCNAAIKQLTQTEKIEGVVVETYLSNPEDYVAGDYYAAIVITNNLSSDSSYAVGDRVYFNSEGFDVSNLLGYTVSAEVGKDTSGEDTIFAIAEKPDSNTLTTISTDLIDSIDVSHIEYYPSHTSKKATEVNIENFISFNDGDFEIDNIVINGFNTIYDIDDVFDAIYDEYIDEVTFLDNDNDGAFEFIYAYAPVDSAVEFLVTDIDLEENYIAGETSQGYNVDITLDLEDPSYLYTFIKDGETATFEDISIGDIVTILDTDVNILTIYASSTKVEGFVEEIDDDVHTIAGNEYIASLISFDYDFAEVGEAGIFYINAFGKVAYIDTYPPLEDGEVVYLIDSDCYEGNFGEIPVLIKVMDTAGEIKTLKLKTNNIEIYEGDEHIDTVNAFYAFDYYFMDFTGLIKIHTTANGEVDEICFAINDYDLGYNEDSAFTFFDRYCDENKDQYNADRGTYGMFAIDSNTILFNIVEDYDYDLEDCISVHKACDVLIDGESYMFTAYGTADEPLAYIVTYNAPGITIPKDDSEVILSSPEVVYLINSDDTEDLFSESKYFIQVIDTNGEIKPLEIKQYNIAVYEGNEFIGYFADYEINRDYLKHQDGLIKIQTTQNNEVGAFIFPVDSNNLDNNEECDFAFYDIYADENEREYNAKRGTYGNLDIAADAIVFNINDNDASDLVDRITVHKASDALVDGRSYIFTAFGTNDSMANFLVTYDALNWFDTEAPVMVVTKVKEVLADEEETYQITGIQNGETVSITVDPDECFGDIEVGNVIMYSTSIISDFATNITLLFTSDKYFPGYICDDIYHMDIIDAFTDEAVSVHYGEITNATNMYAEIDYDKFYYTEDVNVTIVDYTRSSVSITSGTISDVKVSNDDNFYSAFVKTIMHMEDEISDIVIFIEGESNSDEEPTEEETEEPTEPIAPPYANAETVYLVNSDISEGLFGNSTYLMQVMDTTGEIKTLNLRKDNIDIYEGIYLTASNLYADEVFDYIADTPGLIRIKTTDTGEVKTLIFPIDENNLENNDECDFTFYDYYDVENEVCYNAKRGTYGKLDIATDAIVFNIDFTYDDLKDGLTVHKASDVLVDGRTYEFTAFGTNDSMVNMLVTYNCLDFFDTEAPVMVVTKVSTTVYGNEETYKVTGIQNGETVSIIIDPDEYHEHRIEKGNVIMYSTSILNDLACDITLLFSSDEHFPGDICDDIYYANITEWLDDEMVSVHYGEIEKATSSYLEIYGDRFYYADDLNIIIVDYTYHTVQISSGSKSEIKESTDQYNRTAFVKTVLNAEDEITDIVMFIEPVYYDEEVPEETTEDVWDEEVAEDEWIE